MTKPPDAVTRPKIRTQAQTTRQYSNDKIKTLTKLKIQEYLESFFNTTGVNNDLLSIVSPRFINYNTDKSFDPATDPTERKLQIARYFAELKNVLPSILVVDGGINVVPDTIGQVSSVLVCDGEWQGKYPIFRRIPIVIIGAARDVEEADEISGVISLMFNELRNIGCGSHIRGKPDEFENWVITLPNGPVDVGALSEADVPNDPIEKIWYTETVMDVFYQDMIEIKIQIPEAGLEGSLTNIPDARTTSRTAPIIKISSDTISINSQEQIVIQNYQDRYRVILSDSKVATISSDFVLSPRGFGTVTIKVIDPHIGDETKRLLTEKTIEIV